MNELITRVSQKTGLNAEQSQVAVETVVNFLKSKLPSPVAGQIDVLLGRPATGVPVAWPSEREQQTSK